MIKMSLKILVATACGEKKRAGKHRAVDLYKSSRIRAVYNRRSGCDMAILSSKFGLVDSQTIIEDYEEVLTPERIKILLPQVVDYVKRYDVVIYFKAGASFIYFELIKKASEIAYIPIVYLGYGYMAEINKIPGVISEINDDPKFLTKFQLDHIDFAKIPTKKVEKGFNKDFAVICKDSKIPSSEDFQREIFKIFDKAEKEGKKFVEITSGELHREIGFYPGPDHRMASLCGVMRGLMEAGDDILYQPRKGRGATLKIRYKLPRQVY